MLVYCCLEVNVCLFSYFFFQAEDGIRDRNVTGVQTCALPISDVLGRDVDGIRVDVRGHEVERADPAEQRHRDRTGAAAQVDHAVVALQPASSLLDDDGRPGTRDEHPRGHPDAVSVEGGPAEDVLERLTGEATLDQGTQPE